MYTDCFFFDRLSLSGKEYEEFWKNVQFIVDKDVVRTDRSHPYYAGQDNPNVQKMRYVSMTLNSLHECGDTFLVFGSYFIIFIYTNSVFIL